MRRRDAPSQVRLMAKMPLSLTLNAHFQSGHLDALESCSNLVHEGPFGLFRMLRARAVYLMVYAVCREFQKRAKQSGGAFSLDKAGPPAQVRFAVCSDSPFARSAAS
jgi:hypothetical protein